MCPRVFPSAGLWISLGMIAIADLAAMAVTGFRLTGYGALVPIAASIVALALGQFYSTVRPDARIAALGFGAGYLISFTLAGALLSYLGTSLGLPLLDAQFARADAALGLDWMAVLAFTDARPIFGMVLRLAYSSSLPQIALVLVVLAATGQLMRLSQFLALFTATGLLTILMSVAFPAAGAFVFHNPPAELRDVVGQAAGLWHLEHFQALRSGALRAIDPSTIEGLITFPSFHTALAVTTTWAVWRTRYLALPALGLNAVVIASTVPVGGHYFVDIFAGGAIAIVCIAAVLWRPRQHSTRVATAWASRLAAAPIRIGATLLQQPAARLSQVRNRRVSARNPASSS
ncbi:MAG: phosphatase PAP2 family protein [Hyphomonadaceae bacterium]|jgi:membrane-associated phospholipid phosphatase|nr:phosphatase PAP2 family protein [Hyphomonadaceae bacterium]